jgi:hypothetical protein
MVSIIMLSNVMLNVVMLSTVMLNVITLSIVLLNVVIMKNRKIMPKYQRRFSQNFSQTIILAQSPN